MDENTVVTTNSVDADEVDTNTVNANEVNAPKDFADMSEVDIAYKLLAESGKDNPVYFKTLIRTIIKLKGKPVQNEASEISEIYTMINMDSRFQHVGDGRWGLTDWNPPETKRASRARTTTTKTAP